MGNSSHLEKLREQRDDNLFLNAHPTEYTPFPRLPKRHQDAAQDARMIAKQRVVNQFAHSEDGARAYARWTAASTIRREQELSQTAQEHQQSRAKQVQKEERRRRQQAQQHAKTHARLLKEAQRAARASKRSKKNGHS